MAQSVETKEEKREARKKAEKTRARRIHAEMGEMDGVSTYSRNSVCD
jgi:hypothetical protein